MASKNYYRGTLTNEFLGVSKEISAPTRHEFDRKVENQKRIWNEKIQRELDKQNKEKMKLQAEILTNEDTSKISEYENIINTIHKIKHLNYYLSLVDNSQYESFSTNLKVPTMEQVYIDMRVPKKSIMEMFSKKKENERLKKESEALNLFNTRKNYYDKQLEIQKKEYDEKRDVFYENQKKNNELAEEKRRLFENGNYNEIEDYFTYVLNKSIYPKEFIIDFDLQYVNSNKTVVVNYYLPNESAIPKIIQHKYVASKNIIEEVSLNDKKFEKLYNDIIFMCCLKTIKELFLSDEYDYVDNVVFNGWVKYIDKSTGNDAESCILTVDAPKEKFNELNLLNVDYKACIKGLKGIFAPSIMSLTPVVPLLNIDRNDTRFIESREVENITMDGFNLATMPWEDFEYFIRELFEKMFTSEGGEVKVTQASHDGGVDAIAFDDDPIRGGKFVIQAKRYNNVVPVSAVRDLYGTMMHEGATRGILVTTSFYGKEAYDFIKDKPLTLIDGSHLLGLLNKHGYSNLTIKLDKKNKMDNY